MVKRGDFSYVLGNYVPHNYVRIDYERMKGGFSPVSHEQIDQFEDGWLEKHWGHVNWQTEAEMSVLDVHSLLFLKLVSEDGI